MAKRLSQIKILLLTLMIALLTVVSSIGVACGNGASEVTMPPVSVVENEIKKIYTYYDQHYNNSSWGWEDATFQLGAIYGYKATGDIEMYNGAYDYAEAMSWQCNYGVKTTYLDDIAQSQVYCALHELAPADYKLEGVKEALNYNLSYGMLDYSWVDEIYMVGYSQTYLSQTLSDPKYSKIDFNTYSFYRDLFFSPEDKLWYRDAKYVYGSSDPKSVTENGKKVFWSRGNAWVYVSLAQRMEMMDVSNPAYETYRTDFMLLSEGLRAVQRADGTWNSNLGDADNCGGKEITGTGGFLYGMCVGIEKGLLDKRVYLPVVKRAYDGISSCVNSDGFLGYCQPVGEAPADYDEGKMETSTNAFGVGLNLMGLSRFMRLCADYTSPILTTPNVAFDESKAVETTDEGWYKGLMIPTTTSHCEANAPVENLTNGNWSRSNTGSRFSASGIKNGTVVVNIELVDKPTIDKIILNIYQNRAYKYTIEVFDGTTWHTVADTTKEEIPKSMLNKWTFSPITAEQIRLTGSGCYNDTTNWFSIRELLVYEHKGE